MNAHDVNTAARAAPTRTFANLEHQVSSLASMTAIAADLLDRKMTDVRTLAGQRREPGDNWRIILTDHEMNQLSFAWNDVVARVMKLEKDYFAILEGRAEA